MLMIEKKSRDVGTLVPTSDVLTAIAVAFGVTRDIARKIYDNHRRATNDGPRLQLERMLRRLESQQAVVFGRRVSGGSTLAHTKQTAATFIRQKLPALGPGVHLVFTSSEVVAVEVRECEPVGKKRPLWINHEPIVRPRSRVYYVFSVTEA